MNSSVVNLNDIASIYEGAKSKNDVCSSFGTRPIQLALAKKAVSQVNIPEGFVITQIGFNQISSSYDTKKENTQNSENTLPSDIWALVVEQIQKIENSTKKKYGCENPLFLTVSNVAPSPGAICIGMNDYTTRKFEKTLNNRSYAYHCYSEFIKTYGIIVLNIPEEEFDRLLDSYIESRNLSSRDKFNALDWTQVSKLYKSVIVRYGGFPFPQDPFEQLKQIILASVSHYRSEKTSLFRSQIQENSNTGPSILIKEMVFGGQNDKCCCVIASSHDLTSGELKLSGLYGTGAIMTDIKEELLPVNPIDKLNTDFPDAYKTIKTAVDTLVKTFKEPLTVSFCVNENKVTAISISKSTFSGYNRFRAIINLVESKILTTNEAILALTSSDMKSILIPQIKNKPRSSFCAGTQGAHGGAVGIISLSNEDTLQKAKYGQQVIHVKKYFYHSDITSLIVSNGLITSTGGVYSLASYYANKLGKPAAIGCSSISIDESTMTCGQVTASLGDEITVEGGKVYIGPLSLSLPKAPNDLSVKTIMKWIDDARKDNITIYTDSNSIEDVVLSEIAGADGIGMFKIENFIKSDRESIAAFVQTNDEEIGIEIENRLSSLFSDLFAATHQVVTIQLLNDSLTSYLPSPEELTEQIATLRVQKRILKEFDKDALLKEKEELLEAIKSIREQNPFLGLRGNRLIQICPSLFEIQIRGILRGAKASRRRGGNPIIRVLLPLVTSEQDLVLVRNILEEVMLEVEETAELGVSIDCPHACYASGKISSHCHFINLNSNNLHQSTFCMLQKEAEKTYLPHYADSRIFDKSPFSTIDTEGVGKLLQFAVNDVKQINPDVAICITGDNCIDLKSFQFLTTLGISAITCEPIMTLVARLCAAQAILDH